MVNFVGKFVLNLAAQTKVSQSTYFQKCLMHPIITKKLKKFKDWYHQKKAKQNSWKRDLVNLWQVKMS